MRWTATIAFVLLIHHLIAAQSGMELSEGGFSIAMSPNHIAVGDPWFGPGSPPGIVRVFDRATGALVWSNPAVPSETNVGRDVALVGNRCFAQASRFTALAFTIGSATPPIQLSSYALRANTSRAFIGTRDAAGIGRVDEIDPTTMTVVRTFLASDGIPYDGFGQSFDVNETHLVVGAPGLFANTIGAAYIYDLATGSEIKIVVPDFNFAGAVHITDNYALASSSVAGGVFHVFDLLTGTEVDQVPGWFRAEAFGDFIIGTLTSIQNAQIRDLRTGHVVDEVRLPIGFTPSWSNFALDDTSLAVSVQAAGDLGTADRAAFLVNYRPNDFAGTGEGISLQIRGSGSEIPMSTHQGITAGSSNLLHVTSYDASQFGSVPVVLVQAHQAGNAPTSPFPGVLVNPYESPGVGVIFDGNSGSPIGPIVLTQAGLSIGLTIPQALVGWELLFQAFALNPLAANGLFASSIGRRISVM